MVDTKRKHWALQLLFRAYMRKLRTLAQRYGLLEWCDAMIQANKDEQCSATEQEVEMLSRCVGENRLSRVDVAKVLRMSYRKANNACVFDKIKKLPRVGVYSRGSTLLYGLLNKES